MPAPADNLADLFPVLQANDTLPHGPEHAYLRDTGRAKYVAITDVEAMDALMELCKLEGIIPAIESAHAIAYAFKKAKEMTMDQSMVICLSGRGDKDVNTIADYLDGKGYLN